MDNPLRSIRSPEQWILCLTAVAEVVGQLPALYRVVEAGPDDVRIELRLARERPREVVRFREAGTDHVGASVSPDLIDPARTVVPAWVADAADALDADLQWAAARACADQAGEVLSALVRFRVAWMRQDLSGSRRALVERAIRRLRG